MREGGRRVLRQSTTSSSAQREPAPDAFALVATSNARVGRTLPRQLDPELYACILRSTNPEHDFQVPVRAEWLHYTQLQSGHIFLINRPGWNNASTRSAQKRMRVAEDQLPGGWNRSAILRHWCQPPL